MELSIIIPHKNSSALLERLLKSIPANEQWQTIVVDDDSSSEERFAVKCLQDRYSFELYDNKGKGAGGARNTALEYACGEWLIFADADDFFTENLQALFEQYKNCDADLVFFNAISRDSETGEPAERHLNIKRMIELYYKTGEENYLRCKLLGPVAKMVRCSFVHEKNIRFEEIVAGNDMWFSVNIGILAKKVLCDEMPIYVITVSRGSITTTISKDRFDARLEATIRVNRFIRVHHKNRYQISLLYFIGKAYQFGVGYMLSVWWRCLVSGTNLFIGSSKLLKVRSVLSDRQNKKYLVKGT